MYRDWKEVTRSLLSMYAKNGSTMNLNNFLTSKMLSYVDWVVKEVKQNPKSFAQYQKNKGIIKMDVFGVACVKRWEGSRGTEGRTPAPALPKQSLFRLLFPDFKFGHT